MRGGSNGVYTRPMATVAAVLGAKPGLALCMGCLVATTRLRTAAVDCELIRLGDRIQVREAVCPQCGGEPQPVFSSSEGLMPR